MLISECMREYLPELSFSVLREREIDSLGLIISENEKKLCSFVDNEKYLSDMVDNVNMLFITEELAKSIDGNRGCILVKEPRNAFFRLHNALRYDTRYIRDAFDTQIDASASISDHAIISPQNVRIGKNVVIEPFVTIYENTIIGDNCIIHSGARIGGAGFEQKRQNNEIYFVEHLGGTILQNNVQVQCNSCIDRAIYPWDNTIIGAHTKIDNLVYIGHAAKIGACCMIVAQVGVGGRTVVHDNVWLGLSATIRNGICIGEGARVNMGAVVTKNVLEKESVTGNFAIPHDIFMDNLKHSVKK